MGYRVIGGPSCPVCGRADWHIHLDKQLCAWCGTAGGQHNVACRAQRPTRPPRSDSSQK